MPEIEQIAGTLSVQTRLFGKYELGKLLGCGAFAKVYHARDAATGRSVAVKVINKKKIVNTTLMANIKREISIMRQLHHQNIVKIIEVLATMTKIYIVMEFVKGGELFAKVAKGRFSEDLSRKYFRQLISAVGYCHSRGVYHRDLKPENLLIDENGNLKVSDFGLSAFTDQIRHDGLLHTLCGTPAYVAPEILSKRGYDGAKVDVWSCGVILYVLTAGYLPFSDPNLMNMYKKIYKGEFRSPKWMSSDLKCLLSHLLNTDPVARITVDEITRHPWFRRGIKEEVNFYGEDLGAKLANEEDDSRTTFNAFDLISFSSGLDLSGLFERSCGPTDSCERLVVGESPEDIIRKLETTAQGENIRLRKNKEYGVDLQCGGIVIGVEIHRLTETLVVVEVKRMLGDATLYNDLWEQKIRRAILGQPEPLVPGN